MRRDPLAIVDVIPWLLLFLVLIGAGIAAVYFLRSLRNWQMADPDDPATLRAKFRELHRQGKLSAEEYREVQISLAELAERRAEDAEAKADEKRWHR